MNSNWVNDILGIEEEKKKKIRKEKKKINNRKQNKDGSNKEVNKRKVSKEDKSDKTTTTNKSLETNDPPSLSPGDIIEICLSRSLWKVMMRGPLARLHAVTLKDLLDPTTP